MTLASQDSSRQIAALIVVKDTRRFDGSQRSGIASPLVHTMQVLVCLAEQVCVLASPYAQSMNASIGCSSNMLCACVLLSRSVLARMTALVPVSLSVRYVPVGNGRFNGFMRMQL